MDKITPNIDSGVSWIGIILKYLKKYGFFNIIKSCILLILIGFSLKIAYQPAFLFDKYTEYMNLKHIAEKEVRMKNDTEIRTLLPEILEKLKADRVWIVQYHNGTSDWNFGSMRFELCASNVESIKWHYDNFHLSWLELPNYLRINRYYINSVDNLEEVDCALHDMLKKRGIKFFAAVEIADKTEPLGILGCTWEEIPINISDVRAVLNRYSGKLEILIPPQINH